jgi:N-acetyl-gamma-glutamyl-phosphate reductase
MASTALGGAAPARAGLAHKNGTLGSSFKPPTGFMLKTSPKVGCSSLSVRASIASSPQKQYSPQTSAVKSGEEVRIAVLGASGYTGAEIVRLLANHPQFRITVMTADRKAGEQFGSVFPHLITQVRIFLLFLHM